MKQLRGETRWDVEEFPRTHFQPLSLTYSFIRKRAVRFLTNLWEYGSLVCVSVRVCGINVKSSLKYLAASSAFGDLCPRSHGQYLGPRISHHMVNIWGHVPRSHSRGQHLGTRAPRSHGQFEDPCPGQYLGARVPRYPVNIWEHVLLFMWWRNVCPWWSALWHPRPQSHRLCIQ